MTHRSFIALLGSFLLLMLSSCKTPEDLNERFEDKAEWAASAFPAPVIGQETVRQNPGDYLLVDTRSAEEIEVSRLPDAVRWTAYAEGSLPRPVREAADSGRPVVFYCSIGYRSGEAALRAAEQLGPQARVYNLRGGIFQWANEGGTLKGGDSVHGYDREWEEFLRPELRHPIDAEGE